MSAIEPRKIVHRGCVEASGYLFDTELIGVEETRRRILNLWAPGVQVYTHGSRYYVRLLTPVRVDCAATPGTPLVLHGKILAALPLAQDELEAMDAPSDAVVYVSGGCACVIALSSFTVVALETWLDGSQFKRVTVNTLGTAYEAPEVVVEPAPFDARAKLEGAPAATPELLETIAAIKSGTNEKSGASATGTGVKEAVGSLLGSMLGSMGALAGKLSGTGSSGSREAGAGSLEKASSALRWMAMHMLHWSKLGQILGRRQALYMARMMAMFENGNLDDALRHAIPLNDLPPSLGQSPAFGVPTPRANLNIVPQRSQSSRVIGTGENVMDYLRQLYRAAFDRLVAQGRFEEAAFVLAELLRNNEEAVAFLDRHGKLRLAAELAEARNLSPGLVVRQWFLAGDVKRAVGIARRTQAFADAVVRLEKTNKAQAEELRVVWAESLADAGNYAGAVDVLWPVTAERSRAREWMDRTIDVGGPVAARMLARKLSLVPEEFEDIRQRSLSFLEDESFEQRIARLSFAEALCQGTRNAEAQTLARVTTRAILRDAGQYQHGLQPKDFKKLVDFSGDGALRTDVPPLPTNAAEHQSGPLKLEFTAADRGSMPVHDAALLGNGRMLVALGEAGIRLMARDGRTITHFDEPAQRLVLSDHGDRAIALSQRGEVWRLVRLDLLERRATDWCEAHIEAFAPSYDGSLWFVGSKGDFYAIDANAEKFDALWRVPEAGERVVGVSRSGSWCNFVTVGGGQLEQWVYRLPLLTLRSRVSSPGPPTNVSCVALRVALSAEGVYADQSLYCYVESLTPLSVLQLRVFDNEVLKHEFPVGNVNSRPGQLEVFRNHVASTVYREDDARVLVIDLNGGRIVAEVLLAKSKQVWTTFTETALTIADDCGRLLAIDLSRNSLVRNLRV